MAEHADAKTVAIVGGGMAGLACGLKLRSDGWAVSVFDKGRGPGGRLSTRRVTIDNTEVSFDHGAQYFTVRDAEFLRVVHQWAQAGLIAPWPAAGREAWVGVPAMNAPIVAMARSLGVHFATMIDGLIREGTQWRLSGEALPDQLYDAVVIAVPAEQVAPLVRTHQAVFAALADDTPSAPCWTVMAAFSDRLNISEDTLTGEGDIGWAARNSSKPGRRHMEAWVLQASPEWSRRHLNDSPSDVAKALMTRLGLDAGVEVPEPEHVSAHRWLYARSGANGHGHLWDSDLNLGVCGDWLIGPRVEAAWLSGRGLARCLTASIAEATR